MSLYAMLYDENYEFVEIFDIHIPTDKTHADDIFWCAPQDTYIRKMTINGADGARLKEYSVNLFVPKGTYYTLQVDSMMNNLAKTIMNDVVEKEIEKLAKSIIQVGLEDPPAVAFPPRTFIKWESS